MSQAHPLPCPKTQDLLRPRRPWASLVRNSIKTWIMGTGENRQKEGHKCLSFQRLLVKYLTLREHVTIRQIYWFRYLSIPSRTISGSFVRRYQCSRDRKNQSFMPLYYWWFFFFSNISFIDSHFIYQFLSKEKQALTFMNVLIWKTP